MGSQRGVVAATVFFAVTAVLSLVLFRPLDGTGWAVLLTSIVFVLAGCLALWKGDALAASASRRRRVRTSRRAAAPGVRLDQLPSTVTDPPLVDLDAVVAEPSPDEREAMTATLAALREADLLGPDEVDVALLWKAAQASDPGHPVDVPAALAALVVMQELGLLTLRRLVFVPVHVEYDAALVAEITAALLSALGHELEARDVTVSLPAGGGEGAASVAVRLEGRTETVPFRFLVKDPPPDLLEALARRSSAGDPRELVCAVVDQYLLHAAIPPGRLDALNQHFAAPNRRAPREYAFSFDPV